VQGVGNAAAGNSRFNVTDKGIYLHYGDVAIRVARTLRGFRAHIKHLETMANEIEENY
jgi:hypothetical protein